MKLLIGLKYQKWMLVIPMILVFLSAGINYLYNTKISRLLEIMVLFVFVSFSIFIISSFVVNILQLEQYSFFIVWISYYLLGSPASLLIIKLQKKDFGLN